MEFIKIDPETGVFHFKDNAGGELKLVSERAVDSVEYAKDLVILALKQELKALRIALAHYKAADSDFSFSSFKNPPPESVKTVKAVKMNEFDKMQNSEDGEA